LAEGDEPEAVTGPVSSGACEPRTADDGLVAAGTLDDDGRWEVRSQGEPPNETTFAFVDGERVGGFMGDERSQPGRINEGLLPLNVDVTERGVLVYGEVPLATANIEVSFEGGDVAHACPVTVPTDDVVAYFGAALPPGTRPTEARALDRQKRVLASGVLSGLPLDAVPSSALTTMNVDPALVALPLGGTRVELPEPLPTEIVSGEVSSGSWSLAAGQRDDKVIFELRMPSGVTGSSAEGTPAQLLNADRRWRVKAVGNQFVVWGPVPHEVATVTITLADGSSIDASTVEAVHGVPLRAFAAAVPPGGTVTSVEEHRRERSTAHRDEHIASQLAEMSDPVSGQR
jgi:hypothetical protein